MFHALFILAAFFSPSLAVWDSPRSNLFLRQQSSGLNTSALPPGWFADAKCFDDCENCGPLAQFLLGPSFVDSTAMTIELCVDFCDQQNWRMAGVIGDLCRCANMFNPDKGFVSDPEPDCIEAGVPCPGNADEKCGWPQEGLMNIWFKDDPDPLFPGRAALTSGPWRLSNFYNDTVGARALPHNAVDLHPPLESGNLTLEACVNACGSAGFLLAGVEFADECYCGNEIENNSQLVPWASLDEELPTHTPCKGDPTEACGGPGLLDVYTLPGSGLTPLLPFDSIYDGYCPFCSEDGPHT